MLTGSARREVEAALAADRPGVDQLLGALGRLDELRGDLDRAERQLIESARAQGVSWRELAAALGLRSRQAAEQRWLRLRRRDIDTATDPRVQALRAQLTILHGRLARRSDRREHAAPVGLARRTLAAALDAPPGALFDLARLVITDLAGIPAQALGRPVAESLSRVTALAAPRQT